MENLETRDASSYTSRDLDECNALLVEISEQKISVEELSDRCDSLVELTAHIQARDETLALQTSYTTLLTAVQK